MIKGRHGRMQRGSEGSGGTQDVWRDTTNTYRVVGRGKFDD